MPTRKIRLRTHASSSVVPFLSGDAMSNTASGMGTAPLPVIQEPDAPKHVPYNSTIVDSDLGFELRMFLFTVSGAACQFMHIYRSIWWLPYTQNNYHLNYFLMDASLVGFIYVILLRRVIYCMIVKVCEALVSADTFEVFCFRFRTTVFVVMLICLAGFAHRIPNCYSIVNALYLWYPLSMYLFIFGFKVKSLLMLVTTNSNGLPPLHACTNVAGDIRLEVDELKSNFNNRIKQILFNSLLNAYYAGLLPCCFIPNIIYVDKAWLVQHVMGLWIGCFTAYSVHAFPVRFCDTLHRSALHLGYWDKVVLESHSTVVYPWHDKILWPFGITIEHGQEFYRGFGEVNAAEPGHSGYARFYSLFWNPASTISALLVIQASLVLYQLVLLIRSYSCWYQIVSTSLVLVFNYYTLYVIGRNFFVSQRLYNLEHSMHEKSSN